MATNDFKEAIKHFRTGVEKPDLEANLADLPAAHFDAEQIIQSNRRLLEERIKARLA